MESSKKCVAITKKGYRCLHNATKGNYCWTHYSYPVKFQAGYYYVGDLSYLGLDIKDENGYLMLDDMNFKYYQHEVGSDFNILLDQCQRNYPSTGRLGIIEYDCCLDTSRGYIFMFTEDFMVRHENGVFYFGDIEIHIE